MQSTSQTTRTLGSTNRFGTSRTRGLFGRSDVGDSLEDAKDIGTINSRRKYSRSGEVGSSDSDFFKYKIDRTTRITAKLKNEDKDRDAIAMTILDRGGNTIRGNNGKFLFKNIEPGRTKQITANLQAGTYFVRLESAKGRKQDYDFELTADAALSSPGVRPSGNFGDVRNLGRLQSERTYRESGSVGGSDIDSYRFSVDGTSRVLAELENQGNDDVSFRLVNDRGETVRTNGGNFLFSNVRANDAENILAPTLGAGTYQFVIQSSVGRNEDYNFRLQQSPSVPI